jgi:hypothetical protein
VITFPFVPDRHLLTQAILKRVGDPVVSVRILAAWALANLCEALGERDTDAGPTKQGEGGTGESSLSREALSVRCEPKSVGVIVRDNRKMGLRKPLGF